MKITALGHSCLLLSFDTGSTETTLLVDPWLSDHATGDAMGRFPRVRFNASDLDGLDAVFISHAHSDHLDPYTLVRLWTELERPPTLLLPVTLAFLLPVFQEFLEDLDVVVLSPHMPTPFRGLELLGLYDMAEEPTNEDDVMVLVVTHEDERVLIEADARLSLEHPGLHAAMLDLLGDPSLGSAVYLTTENELTGTLESRNCRSVDDRHELQALAMQEMLDAVEHLYAPIELDDVLWNRAHVVRLIHGQGLTAPHELDPRNHHLLFPVRIEHRVEAERQVASRYGYAHWIDTLHVGREHTLERGRISDVQDVDWLHLLDEEEARTYLPELDFFPVPPLAPLRSDRRDTSHQRARIEALLNERFLPHLHGDRRPPVLHLLTELGEYRVRIHFGSTVDQNTRDYVLTFNGRNFVEQDPMGQPHEAYWANDLDDVLEGTCDDFTVSCRQQFPTTAMKLWSCLAVPMLNSDLVTKRVRLHFERAQQGLDAASFVLPLHTL